MCCISSIFTNAQSLRTCCYVRLWRLREGWFDCHVISESGRHGGVKIGRGFWANIQLRTFPGRGREEPLNLVLGKSITIQMMSSFRRCRPPLGSLTTIRRRETSLELLPRRKIGESFWGSRIVGPVKRYLLRRNTPLLRRRRSRTISTDESNKEPESERNIARSYERQNFSTKPSRRKFRSRESCS